MCEWMFLKVFLSRWTFRISPCEKLLMEEEKHVTRNAISSPWPVHAPPGEHGGEPIGGAGLLLPFFPPFQLKELSSLPRHAACAHSNTAQLTPDWRGQAAPAASRMLRTRHVRLRPGRDAGPRGSDWQPESARLTSSTPDDGGARPDKAVSAPPS